MGLTDVSLKSAKPKEKQYKLSDGRGLYVLIMPTGGKYFQYDYNYAGKRKTLALGVYPKVSLREAREKLENAKKLLDEGIDPVVARKMQKHKLIADSENTLKAIAGEWFEKNKAKWTARHAEDKWHKLERDIFPYLGDIPIKIITPQELLAVIRKIETRGSIETAHRTKNIVGEVFGYAIAAGAAERNIALDLTGALAAVPKAEHRAAITDPVKIGELLRVIDSYDGEIISKCALRISPYVMLRPMEIASAEWTELDLENRLWKIPAEKMKMRRPHIVPLAGQVVEIFRELQHLEGKYVFPSLRTKTCHINESTVNAAIRRMGYTGEEMTAHGFRGMAATLLYENGFESDIVEMQLAHVEKNKVKAAYNHAEYLDKRRAMMDWWANYLNKLRDSK